ncbi:hypothetical protein EVAR_81999_1 [Eumeta japonica]|uniref:Uncharacterized protein n=1 Tax=Eumeta variegata TaxID=151549 RepID=A0A4C1VWF6_EUMVA|nr:hypothetical protein EVAR_81999_1 [Eumeta japonica]
MLYFRCFCLAADTVSKTAAIEVLFKWDAANMLMHVASQIRQYPLFQGINVIPSGRLPSEQLKSEDSSVNRTLSEISAHRIISLRGQWRANLQELR